METTQRVLLCQYDPHSVDDSASCLEGARFLREDNFEFSVADHPKQILIIDDGEGEGSYEGSADSGEAFWKKSSSAAGGE